MINRPVIGVGTLTISDKAKKYVNDVLNNNRLSYGPYLKQFETKFAQIHQAQHAIVVNSGTDALRIALHALKEKHKFSDGDEVLVPAVTFVATINIVLQNGLTPRFVDVDPLYYELDPRLLEKHITPKTKAIIPVHLFGQPCDMDPIIAVAQKYDLKIIEDSCETMFAHYKGRPVGTFGDFACFSTYVAHLIVTGVGGILLTNNNEHAVLARSLANHGRDPVYISIDDDQTGSFEELTNIVNRRFSFSHVGYSCRVTEMEGALGVAQLEDYQTMLKKRKSVAQKLDEALTEFKEHLQLPGIRPGNDHSFMMYPLVCRHESKEGLTNFLEQTGIETRDMFPLTNQSLYKDIFKFNEKDFPTAAWINKNGFYIGCHQDITDDDIAYIKDNFRSYFLKDSPKFKKEPALIILRNTIPGYNNLTKIKNIPFQLFKEALILGDPVSAEVKEYISQSLGQVTLKDNIPMARLMDVLRKETRAENIVFFDLTNMHNPLDIKRILFKLENGADMAIASRFIQGGKKSESGRMAYRGVGNRLFTGLMNIIFDGNFTDAITSLRGIKRPHLVPFQTTSGNWYDFHFNLSICAIKNALLVEEFPSKEILFEDTRPVHNVFISSLILLTSLIKRVADVRAKTAHIP